MQMRVFIIFVRSEEMVSWIHNFYIFFFPPPPLPDEIDNAVIINFQR